MGGTDFTHQDKTVKLLIENLKTRKYRIAKQDKIISLDGKSKHQTFNANEIELVLVKTPWDTNVLKQKDQSKKDLTPKTLRLNLYLESYQSVDTAFSDILNVG